MAVHLRRGLKMDSKIKKLCSRTVLFTVGKFISKILAVLLLPLYTNLLSTAEYSTADLLTNMANLLIPVVCLGINEGIFRSTAAKETDPAAVFSTGMGVFLCGEVVFLLLSPLLMFVDVVGSYWWLVVVYVLASDLHSICSQYICATGHERLYAGQGILNTALVVVLNILFLAVFRMGVVGYVLAVGLADFLTAMFLVAVCRLYRVFRPSLISRTLAGQLLRFSAPLIPTTVFWWITSVSDRYLVQRLRSPAENGLYAAAYRIPTLLLFLVTIFNEAWKLSTVENAGDIRECERLYDRVFPYYTALMFSGGAALMLMSYPLACLLFSAEYRAGWIYIPILVAATVCSAFDNFFGNVYYVRKRTAYSLFTAMAGAGMNIVLNLLLIPDYGAMGASVATVASYFVVFLIRALTVPSMMRFRLHPVYLAVNFLLCGLLATGLSLYDRIPYAPIPIAAVAVMIFALNARTLFRCAKGILTGYLHRRTSAEKEEP